MEGNRIVDIDAAALAIHQQAGTSQYLFARTGHGIGFGGHEFPDDMAYNDRPLRAGMVLSSEPAVFGRGLGGFRHSDTIIVGKEQPESVTTFSQDLAELVITARFVNSAGGARGVAAPSGSDVFMETGEFDRSRRERDRKRAAP